MDGNHPSGNRRSVQSIKESETEPVTRHFIPDQCLGNSNQHNRTISTRTLHISSTCSRIFSFMFSSSAFRIFRCPVKQQVSFFIVITPRGIFLRNQNTAQGEQKGLPGRDLAADRKCLRPDSNRQPAPYESAALTLSYGGMKRNLQESNLGQADFHSAALHN